MKSIVREGSLLIGVVERKRDMDLVGVELLNLSTSKDLYDLSVNAGLEGMLGWKDC